MNADLLTPVLRAPERLAAYDLGQWDVLLRQARAALLLSRLALLADNVGATAALPAPVAGHLRAARTLAQKQAQSVRWEVKCVQRALHDLPAPLILLKGAAYLLAGLRAGRGRLFADVDILLPKSLLGRAENDLMLDGWTMSQHNAYDQRYYRRWMHELPPLKHALRESVLDVHHAILPETSRLRFSAAPLFEAARPLSGWDGVRVLAPADMVLHSAVHLFSGEFDHGLRDLADLDSLLREFASPPFWLDLTARADALALGRPLYYAITQLSACLATPIPGEVVEHVQRYRPSPAVDALMRVMHGRLLRPGLPGRPRVGKTLARQGAFVHAHWLRMPAGLLLYHLFYKSAIAPWRSDEAGSL